MRPYPATRPRSQGQHSSSPPRCTRSQKPWGGTIAGRGTLSPHAVSRALTRAAPMEDLEPPSGREKKVADYGDTVNVNRQREAAERGWARPLGHANTARPRSPSFRRLQSRRLDGGSGLSRGPERSAGPRGQTLVR